MIVSQSSRLVATLSRSPDSPEGCGTLAGDNIPGIPSLHPRALKGRWIEPPNCSSSPFFNLPTLTFNALNSAAPLRLCATVAESVLICVHSWLNPEIAKRTQFSTQTNPFKGFQSLSKRFKAIQRVWKTFFIMWGNHVSDPASPSTQKTKSSDAPPNPCRKAVQ